MARGAGLSILALVVTSGHFTVMHAFPHVVDPAGLRPACAYPTAAGDAAAWRSSGSKPRRNPEPALRDPQGTARLSRYSRKVIDFIRQHHGDFDAAIAEQSARLVGRFDPPVAT
jgi:hypothetical protein